MSSLIEFSYSIKGITPLILHSVDTANPLNPIAIEFKKISSKRTKTQADYEEMAHIEWLAGHYWGADGKTAVIPEKCLIACIRNGARKFNRGKDIDRSLFIAGDFPLIFDGPTDPEERYKDRRFILQNMMTVDRRKVLRTRPIYFPWALEFSGHLDTGQMNKADLDRFVEKSGLIAGLGDSRPRYGKFSIE